MGIGFNHYLHFGVLFQFMFLAVFVLQRVFDTNLPIELVSALHGDLRLSGRPGWGDLIILRTHPALVVLDFVVMALSLLTCLSEPY